MGSLGGEVDQTDDADRPDVPRKLARPDNVDFTIDAKLLLIASRHPSRPTERLRRWKPPLVQYLRRVVRTV